MDLDQVFFSNIKKFDGKKLRRLNISEIGQIAGRAGRYLNHLELLGIVEKLILRRLKH